MIAAASPPNVHPLRDSSLRIEDVLIERGLAHAPVKRKWRPWRWSSVARLYHTLGYIPSPGQEEFHRSTARWKVLACGARYGKSMSAAREALPVVLSPGTNTWILGPSYDLAEKEWRFLVDDLAALGLLGLATRKSMSAPHYLEFPWGSRVWTRTADNPTSLLGEELDLAVISEASQLPPTIFNRYLRARLGPRLGRVIIPTTPFGYGYVRDKFVSGIMQQEAGDAVTWNESVHAQQVSVLLNPYFDPQEYLAAQAELPEEEFAEQYDGLFTTMSGRMFPGFRRRPPCVIEEAALPQELHGMPVFRSVDFGFANPTAALWFVYDKHGIGGAPPRTWWAVGEIYRKQLLSEQLAEEIKAHPWSRNHRVICTIGDMADAQARATLSRHGVPCAEDLSRIDSTGKTEGRVPIDKAVAAGWRTMRSLFHAGRLRISTACPNLIREADEAMWADNGKDRIDPQCEDHALDATRYLTHTVTPV